MDNLMIENPVRLTDTSFKITINGQDYEYEVSEEKDIDAVIDKLNKWIDRGEDSFGGLYDYIKRTFKLVGEYEEPIEEMPEEISDEPEEVDIPSDIVDVDEPVANQLDINVSVDEQEVSININEWSAKFNIIEDDDTAFTDMLSEYINDDMTLKDRTELIIELAKMLEANDTVDFYNLFNLILDTGVDIVNSFDEAEEAIEEPEEDTFEEPSEDLDMSEEPTFEEAEETDGEQIVEDFYEENTGEPIEDEDDEDEVTIESLVKNESFLDDLIKLDLSFYELKNKDDEKIYFIGGINNKGNKFSLSYSTKPPIELIDDFDQLKELPECLNNMDNLDKVVDYVNKLLDIVYNKELKDMED